MNEWQVIGVIIALVGLLSAIVAPIIKINTAAVKLTAAVDGLEKTVSGISADNKEEHNELWQVVDKHDTQLADHDKRLAIIEHKEG